MFEKYGRFTVATNKVRLKVVMAYQYLEATSTQWARSPKQAVPTLTLLAELRNYAEEAFAALVTTSGYRRNLNVTAQAGWKADSLLVSRCSLLGTDQGAAQRTINAGRNTWLM